MNSQPDELVADTVIRWVQSQVANEAPPRLNLRMVFGDEILALRVRAGLEARSDERRRYFVRRSADGDAVRLRNGRPEGTPTGSSVIYVLFWQPGSAGHERNAQSLSDLRAVDVSDLLADSMTFLMPLEQAIERRCDEAAQAWKESHRERATEHLRAAWRAVRLCLRERRGGRLRSIPFVSRVEDYCRYLLDAYIPDDVWATIPLAERADQMVQRWGEALPALSMFTFPALGSMLGVRVDPTLPIDKPRKTREPMWAEDLAGMLAENIEYAVDFSSLEEALAGKRTLQEQLDALTKIVPLRKDDALRDAARISIERFCHDGDEAALQDVEWAFLKDPANRRSASLGLHGLLLARGRRAQRPDPLERATSDTLAVVDALLGTDSQETDILRQYVTQQKQQVAADPRNAATMNELLVGLGNGMVAEVAMSTEVYKALERAAAAPGLKTEGPRIHRVAGLWDALVTKAPEKSVDAPGLLLGLARLCAQRAGERAAEGDRDRCLVPGASPGDRMVLALLRGPDDRPCSLELPVQNWGEEALGRIAEWLQMDVRQALFDKEEDEGEDIEALGEMEIQVSRRPAQGRGTETLGTLKLRWSARARKMWRQSRSAAPMSWRGELAPDEASAPVRLLQGLLSAAAYPEAQWAEVSVEAWDQYVRALGREPGWEVAALVGPVISAGRRWVTAWSNVIEEADRWTAQADAASRREDLNVKIADAVRRRAFAEAAQLTEQLDALPPGEAETKGPGIKEVQSLLRAATVSFRHDGRVERLALTPFHPLAVRLRAISDQVLAEILHALWTDGWPAVAFDELDDALRNWGLPEPMHAYGFWDGDPLAFEDWVDGFALFTRLGNSRDADAASMGAREVARVVGRYTGLFPAAADRLKLRTRADREGCWAWNILDARLGADESFRADVDLVTGQSERDATVIERRVHEGEEHSEAFELGPEGVPPRVRVRRQRENEIGEESLHLSLLVGDQIQAFQPSWDRQPKVPGALTRTGIWYSRILFDEPQPALRGYAFHVGDPEDELCRRAGNAIGFAAGTTGAVFRERYSFDPSRCEDPLVQQQGMAHWLVIASRQPLYRAVQQVGSRIATLLDFYTLIERGRPVHVCVSLNTRRAEEDLKRLGAALRALLGADITEGAARTLVAAALRLAPGLAMRCAGAIGAVHLGGLLGLLLTGATLRADNPSAIVLALDQHQELLGGKGRLGDLLVIRQESGTVRISIGESKFTTNEASSTISDEARRQVAATVDRLRHLAVTHPLRLRTRRRLLRAIVHQIHLAELDASQQTAMENLVQAARDPDVPIHIEPAERGSVHVWSTASGSQEQSLETPDMAPVTIHARASTLGQFQRLASF